MENNTGMIQMWGSFSRSDFCASVSRFACAFTISIFKTLDPRGGAGRGPRGVRYYRKTDCLAYGDGVKRAVQRRESSGILTRFTRAHASCGSRVARSADTSGAWLRFRPSSRVSGLWPRAHREAVQRTGCLPRPRHELPFPHQPHGGRLLGIGTAVPGRVVPQSCCHYRPHGCCHHSPHRCPNALSSGRSESAAVAWPAPPTADGRCGAEGMT